MATPGYPPPPQQAYGYPPQPGYPSSPQPGYPPPQQGFPSAPQGYPPAPQAYPPPPQGYPSQGQYPYPPQQPSQPPYSPGTQYHPPPQHSYPPQPPQGYPPQHYPAPYPAQSAGYPPPAQSPYPPQAYPPPQPQASFPPPQAQGSFPPPQHQGTYPPQAYHPNTYAPPINSAASTVPGYGNPSPSYVSDIHAIFKACKGFGCDERTIISILGTRDAATINAIRQNYKQLTKKTDLVTHLIKETSGNLETTLVATALGPDESEAYWAHQAMNGIGTNEVMLTEALCGKKNWQIDAIAKAYRARYGHSLESKLKGDLSGKTERVFLILLEKSKQEDWIQPDPNHVERDVKLLWTAGEGRVGTDEIQFGMILMRSNDAYLRALAAAYERSYGTSLRKVIMKEFSGHLKQAFTYILDGAQNKAARDAVLLEESMKGLGTKDDLLISRLVRAHWDKSHMEAVKREYFRLYSRDLIARIKGDTSGNYEKMLVTLAS